MVQLTRIAHTIALDYNPTLRTYMVSLTFMNLQGWLAFETAADVARFLKSNQITHFDYTGFLADSYDHIVEFSRAAVQVGLAV